MGGGKCEILMGKFHQTKALAKHPSITTLNAPFTPCIHRKHKRLLPYTMGNKVRHVTGKSHKTFNSICVVHVEWHTPNTDRLL